MVAKREGIEWIVGDVEAGARECLEDFADECASFVFGFGVDGSEGFVEDEDVWVHGQCTGDGDTLGLSAGELVGFSVGEGLDFEAFEEGLGEGAGLGGGMAIGADAKGDVVDDPQVSKEALVLKEVTDAAGAGWLGIECATGEGEGALDIGEEPGDGMGDGAFA